MIRTDAPPLAWLVYEADWPTLARELVRRRPPRAPVDLAPYLELMHDRACWVLDHVGTERADAETLGTLARYVGARLRLGMEELDRSFFDRGLPEAPVEESDGGEPGSPGPASPAMDERASAPAPDSGSEPGPEHDHGAFAERDAEPMPSPRTPIQTPSRVLAIGVRQRGRGSEGDETGLPEDAVLAVQVPASWPYAVLALALVHLAGEVADEDAVYARGFGPAPCMAAAMEALIKAEESAHNAMTASASRRESGWEAFTNLVAERVLAGGDLEHHSGRKAAEHICTDHAELLESLGKDPLAYADSLRRLINRKRKDAEAEFAATA
jgi:hypothetical protein